MRFLHTMLRVRDLDKELAFFTQALGMKVLRRQEYHEGRFTLVFVGYGDESNHTVLELTYNWDTDDYETGNAFGHIAIEVQDASKACERVRSLGYVVKREAGPMKHGTTIIAFCSSPTGYLVEFIEKIS
ncbi:MAG: lactoylglutathione lyase [Proteobacteria bacterium]|nr:lactoylglutathione lyase [Pseudomonadota bacterium]